MSLRDETHGYNEKGNSYTVNALTCDGYRKYSADASKTSRSKAVFDKKIMPSQKCTSVIDAWVVKNYL